MSQYIALIQGNAKTESSGEEWDQFLEAARDSGLFRGGSGIGERVMVGDTQSAEPTQHVVGYMRFDSDDRQGVLDLLQRHPVVVHGGSVELCEMPAQVEDSAKIPPGVMVNDRSDHFERDRVGRTALFDAAQSGDLEEVRRMIFSLAGTGMCCQRLSLIGMKDPSGFTASDVAEQNGHKEIAELLVGEQMRMEFFE